MDCQMQKPDNCIIYVSQEKINGNESFKTEFEIK